MPKPQGMRLPTALSHLSRILPMLLAIGAVPGLAQVAEQLPEQAAKAEPTAEAVTVESVTPLVPDAPSAAAIPAGTFIMIQLDAPVSSRTAARGDMFPISLAEPVRIDGVDVLPAGITGEGQVVHSAGTGFGGRAGELIVAARYLTWGERRIPLRGMRISAAGRNNTAEAIAASAVLSVAGLFITGTSVDLPAGQIAVARLAEAVPLETMVEGAAEPAEVPAETAAPAETNEQVQQGGSR